MLDLLAKYTLWADAEIWNVVQSLSDDEFETTFDSNLGSIRKRYDHMAKGHSEWYQWISGDTLPDTRIEEMSRGELFAYLTKYNRALFDEVLRAKDSRITLDTSEGTFTFSAEMAMMNIVNHATYHRGQVVALLRKLGKAVPVTDLFPYLMRNQ